MAVRVRQSPFGGAGGGAPGGQAPGQGLTQAPTPAAQAAPAGTDFDFFEEWGNNDPAAQPAQPQGMRVSAPQSQGGYQQPGFPQQQGYQQPGFPQQQQQQQPGYPQQQGYQQPGFPQQQQQPPAFPQQPQAQAYPQQPQAHAFPQQPQAQAYPQQPQAQAFPQQQQQQPQQQQQIPQQQPQQSQQPGQTPQLGQEMGQMLAGGMGAMGMNSVMANVVADQLQDQLKQQLQSKGFFAMFPAIFLSLQQLFSVGHSFVLRKLLLLLCPFIKGKDQGAPSTNAWGGEASPGAPPPATGPDNLRTDVEEPDLYIPAMAYVTYVLLYGVHRGMLKEFNPKVLSDTFSFALVLLMLEVGGFYMAFYFASNPVPALPLAANCGYKYVPCVLMVIARILTGTSSTVYYVFFAYFAACGAWSIRRFMMRLEPSQIRQQYGVPTSPLTKHIITAMAVAQVPICFILLRGA